MDNYPSYSYPDSGDSSPRSREIDFENPPPSWEEQQPQPPLNHKVKFMVSYGGKIQPRSHDNLLSYVGGETKILSLDRNIKFNSLFSKLSSIVSPDSEVVSGFTFKYQLPGEELDALISVTNDDDLENMMHEYDRLYRGSSKPARLRLFLFPVGSKSGSFGSTCSDPGKIERDSDRFVEALNSGHTVHPPSQPQVVTPPPLPQVTNNVDLLFGLEKQHQQIPHPHHHPVQVSVPLQVSDPQIDARIQDLNRMHISVPKHEPDPNVFTGAPATIPASVQVPAQYWQPPSPPVNVEQQPPPPQPHHHHQFHHQHPPPQQQHQQLQPQQQQHQQPPPPQQQQQHHPQQAVYMMHPGPPPPQQGNMMHAPSQMMRPPPTQGYYQVRVPEQQQQQPPPQQQQQQQPVYNMNPGNMGGYSESMGLPVRPVPGMAQDNQQGYTQVAYDNGSGRQVYYAAQQQQQQGSGGGSGGGGVVTTSYQGAAVSGGDMRNMAAESKVVQKVVPTSNSVV